jgi:predicted metallo-beta-lactamase superfamily hydrolase
MQITLCPFKCPQSSTCARYDDKPEQNKDKVHFIKSPKNEIGCSQFKRKKEKKYERK